MGASWMLRSGGYEETHCGLLSGNAEWQRDMSMKLIIAAMACGAQTPVLPEFGRAHRALRWQGANMYAKPLPFSALHISAFLA